MKIPALGGCLCGAVRYQLGAAPITLYACHCTDCQRRTGSGFALSMLIARKHVQLLQGATSPYSAAVSGGRSKQGQLCAQCGTRLWGEPVKTPHLVVVQPGTLDDTSWVRPVAHIWTRSAQPWMVFPSEAVVFATHPEDPMTLVNLWREHGAK